jgi:hypothetical protein
MSVSTRQAPKSSISIGRSVDGAQPLTPVEVSAVGMGASFVIDAIA